MTIDEFIIDLRSKNIIISVQDNNVAVRDPDEALTSDIITAIREKKQEILSFYNNVKKDNEFEYIKLASKQEDYPVSFGQKRLWILDQLMESNGLYNVNLDISLHDMEITIIQQALNFLIERHEILRTTFKVIKGAPRQYIEKIEEFDLTIQYKKAQSKIEYEQLKEEELFYPFQLEKAAVKATIIEDEKGNSTLFFVLHHIIVDGWSTEIIKKEFAHIYESLAKGIRPNLKPLSIQYKDYAVWQNDLVESGSFKSAKTFWNQKFSSEISRLRLPVDDIQSEEIVYKGTNAYFEIPQDITAKLIQYADQQDASLFMVLLGMVKTLFYRYTGQEDIIIGSVVSGREHISLQEQIGFFVNTIALKTHVKGTDTFNKVLEKIKSTTLDAFEYQSYPFDMLVEDVNEKVEKNRNPIFDVLFNYAESVRDNQDNETSLSEGEMVFEKTTASKFDLSFDFIKIKDGGIKGIIGYNTELFLKEKIIRMAEHFIGIARAVIAKEEQPIFEFEYFQKEKKHIVNTFNSLGKELSYAKEKISSISIEKPEENTQIYILDQHNKIVPIGIVGEIGIAGKCLAKGYLNMPEKTDQQFIHCELNKGEEVRIYKTGDYGKWLGDGTIQYLGRIDNQTSINGYRIELEEIESFMCQYSKLRNAVVIPKQGEQGNWHLVAYYTLLKEKQSFGNEIITKTGIPSMVTNVSNYNITNVYEMLQKTSKEHSEKIALEYNATQISYGSLFDEVEKFSAYLLETYNVQVGDHVVLVGGRSERTIVSLLAILKLGAVYVPVDNEYPKSRIDYIIQDSNPTLIIAEATLSFQLETFDIPLIYNDYRLCTKGYKPLKEEIKIQQDDLSYICYTSGSTGKPKGVMIPQKSVVDYIKTFTDYFKLTNTDVVIQQSSISFDTSIEEILPTLYSGAKLVILPDGGRNIEAIISTINNNGVSILSTTPLVINELNRYCNQLSRFPRAIISGGDILGGSYIDQLLEETTIFNTYGPTEFTVCASFHQIVNKEDSNTIGHPIANHTIYLLDDEMNPVVDGAIGEIFIEGAGMAKGYLNNNKETAKYFVSNPFNEGLFYKTGDLAYRNDKQELIFCGRKDNQVKINGYRIELIEIDKALQELSGISNCISTAKSDTNNTKHLVTYYVGSNDISKEIIRTFLMEKLPHYMVPDYIVQLEEIPQNSNGKIDVRALPTPESLLQDEAFVIELKKFLKRKMPAYMIPSHFVHLEAMPLTVSGKIDRKSLEKRAIQSNANNECLEPKNETETQLRAIWQYCLDVPKIGTNINFFELGGNSIKATQIMSKIHETFAQKIPLKSIYNNPTIVELANFIEGGKTKNTLLLHLNKFESNQPNIFCIPPILGSSTVFKNMAVALNKHANIYGLQYRGFDADEPFDKSIHHMAESFIYEIQKVINNEQPVIIVGYSMGATIAFEIVKTLEATHSNIKLVLLDRGIQKEGESALTASEINILLEQELILWKKEMSTSDFERIKRLVIHNTKILAAHELLGNIKADILAIEAVNDLAEANMTEWEALSSGAFTHQYIKANHYEILETESESIIKLLKQLIQENHYHDNHNQRKMTLRK